MSTANEIDAMRRIAEVLDEFGDGDSEARARILQWVTARYGGLPSSYASPPQSIPGARQPEEPEEDDSLEDLADLFDAAGAQTDSARALVVGYWLTEPEGKSDFTSQEVNSELKNLGYGVTNITSAFSSLMKRKPALAMQTAKTGATQQARKRYKLTRAGRTAVRSMIQAKRESEG